MSKHRKSFILLDISRYIGLTLILGLIWTIRNIEKHKLDKRSTNNGFDLLGSSQNFYDITNTDTSANVVSSGPVPGFHFNKLKLYHNEKDIYYDIPVFMSQDVSIRNEDIIDVLLIQHGNLRNGYDYFSAALNILSKSKSNLMRTVIIAFQFLIDNDICYDAESGNEIRINLKDKIVCGYPIFTSDGWKNGERSLTYDQLFSYDIYNMVIDHLGQRNMFPNLRTITFFGFSAGGQVALRYAAIPNFNIQNPLVQVRFVVSDPSSFLYLDRNRPYTNESLGFGIPDASWLPIEWLPTSNGTALTITWDSYQCQNYNSWRYGLENLKGSYAEYIFKKFSGFEERAIRSKLIFIFIFLLCLIFKCQNIEFQYQDITYLLGTADDTNCKLESFPSCDDHELVTSCQAMLQGKNRVDRMRKWLKYLEFYFGHQVHHIVEAAGVPHDAIAMMSSNEGKCVIFGICEEF